MVELARLTYPTPPTTDQVDDYHGTAIADPYRPLEDSDAPATRAWIEAENALTEAVLGGSPARDEIRARLARLWDFPRAGAPWRRGDRWFQLRNTGLQDQDVLWTAGSPDDEGRVLVDPNGLSAQGTTTLSAIEVSDGGELVACAISDAGSDWRTWTVRNVATGEVLPDRIPWSKFTRAAWTKDDAGFFYCRYPEPPADAAYDAPNRDMELRYHRMGTDPAGDAVVFSTPDEPEWLFDPEVSEDGGLLVVTIERGTDPETRIFVADLADGVDRAIVPAAPRGGRRPLRARRDHRPARDPADQPRRAAQPGHRRGRGRSLADRRAHPGGRRRPGARRRWPGTGWPPLPPRRPPPARAVRARRAARDRTSSCPGIGMVDDLAGRRDDPDLYLGVRQLPRAVDRARGAAGGRRGPRGRPAAPGLGPGRLRHRAGLRRPPTTAPACRCS